ncbi:MAG TPA: hypothetical protein VGA16_01535 [Candidatus Limnocylindria bacterium]
MRRGRGSIRQAGRNFGASDLPLARRALVALRNALRRFGPPPRDCCGHPGEPGC